MNPNYIILLFNIWKQIIIYIYIYISQKKISTLGKNFFYSIKETTDFFLKCPMPNSVVSLII